MTRPSAQLAALESTHARETSAVLVQRDEVAQLHLAVVNRQLEFVHARDRKSAELGQLQSHKQSLEHELVHVQAQRTRRLGRRHLHGPDRRLQRDARKANTASSRRPAPTTASARSRRWPTT